MRSGLEACGGTEVISAGPGEGRRSLRLLLAGDGALGALAGARVGLGALAADRKAHAVAATLVAADLDLAADVRLDLTSEVTLDLEVGFDLVAKLDQLLVTERVNPSVRVDSGGLEQLLGAGTADAVDVGECDLDALVAREVDTNEACHVAVSLSVHALVSGRVASHPASGELRPKRRRWIRSGSPGTHCLAITLCGGARCCWSCSTLPLLVAGGFPDGHDPAPAGGGPFPFSKR